MFREFPYRLKTPLLMALLGCAVACVAISSQSLWIDEAQTAMKAIPPTLHGWWQALDNEHNSNMQLPLYMLYIWGWARVFGLSEVALRAANAPWFLLGLCGIAHFLRRHPGLRGATILIYSLHPFVWSYLNEARPYIMQLAAAILVSGCLFVALDQPEEPLPASWWWLFFGGLVILCGGGLLGVPWAIAITLLLAGRAEFRKSIFRAGLPALAACAPILVVLALYFAWTLKQNIEAGYRPMSFPVILSVFYDQLGFMGLGPGRDALRPASVIHPGDESIASLRGYILPLALLGLPLAAGLIVASRRRFGISPARLITVLLLAGSPACLIFALGFIRHVRILSRHLTPLFPFILLAQAYAVFLLWKSGRPLGRATAVLIVIALTLSSLETRFAFRHSKDDYRAAAAAAIQALAAGKTVWWAAAAEGAKYYRVPLVSNEVPGAARFIYALPPGFSAPPDEIVLSKPDVFDTPGTLTNFIATHHYREVAAWKAFTLWEKPEAPGG
jgi:hypothetical protein